MKKEVAEDPPPGDGVVTVIDFDPAEGRAAAGIEIDRCDESRYLTDNRSPSMATVQSRVNPVPTRATSASVATGTASGVADATDGTGFVMENCIDADLPPPGEGLTIAISTLAAAAKSVSLKPSWI